MHSAKFYRFALLVAFTMVTACTHLPDSRPTAQPIPEPVRTETRINNTGNEIALRALALVGKPYRYGGADLQGFDCSGLVYFIHDALGLKVPRTAAEQQRAALNIGKPQLQPGDLLFFKTTSGPQVSHVAIYVGENRFVHAPRSGMLIELRSMNDSYYATRLISMGRLHPIT